VVVEARLERGEIDRGAALLESLTSSDLDPKTRVSAARLWLRLEQPQRALALLGALELPEAQLIRCHAQLALEQLDDARAAYRAALEGNVTLEDRELEAKLYPRGEPRSQSPDGRLRIVASDDTDADELRRLLGPKLEPIRFADVGGLEPVKKQIRRKIIVPFQKPGIFARFQRRVGGGIMMYGPPGCGKTMLARATAGEADATFINVHISDVLDMYIGESERKLHAIFERAREKTPSVLFFDEFEALAAKRKFHRESTTAKLVSLFLSEMDGFAQNNAGVLVIGATNVPWSVDPAFLRPGRFDRSLFVPPPDAEARRAILDHALRERPVAGDIDLRKLVVRTSGYSGADLINIIETAIDEAIEESLESGAEVPIQQGHLQAAVAQIRPTTHEWLTTARNYARYANDGGRYDEVLEFIAAHGKKGSS
jgi:transitional endoplasmic reticulum ATPase